MLGGAADRAAAREDAEPDAGIPGLETDWFSLSFTETDSGSSSESESISDSRSVYMYGHTETDEEWARQGTYSPSSNSTYLDSEGEKFGRTGSVVGDSLDAERAGSGWEAAGAFADNWDMMPPSPSNSGESDASNGTEVDMPIFEATVGKEGKPWGPSAPVAFPPPVRAARALVDEGVLGQDVDLSMLEQLPPMSHEEEQLDIMMLPALDVPEEEEPASEDPTSFGQNPAAGMLPRAVAHQLAPQIKAEPGGPQIKMEPGQAAAVATEELRRSTSGDGTGEDMVCPFCNSAGPESDREGKKTRMRRKRETPRRKQRFGRWWRMLGYDGPPYCQRCSEVFRDHLMRQTPNSAECSRENPCDDCARVVACFVAPTHAELWERIDARCRANKQKQTGKRARCKIEPGTESPTDTEGAGFPAGVRAEQSMKRACLGQPSAGPVPVLATLAAFSVMAVAGTYSFGSASGDAGSGGPALRDSAASVSIDGSCAYLLPEDLDVRYPTGIVPNGESCPEERFCRKSEQQDNGYYCRPGEQPARMQCRDCNWVLPFGILNNGCVQCEENQFSQGGLKTCQPCSTCPSGDLVRECTPIQDSLCSSWVAVLQKGVDGKDAFGKDAFSVDGKLPEKREYASSWVVRGDKHWDGDYTDENDTLYLFGGIGKEEPWYRSGRDPSLISANGQGYRGDMWRGKYTSSIMPLGLGRAPRVNLTAPLQRTLSWTRIGSGRVALANYRWPEYRTHAMSFVTNNIPFLFGGYRQSPAAKILTTQKDPNGFGSRDLWRFEAATADWVCLGGWGTDPSKVMPHIHTLVHDQVGREAIPTAA